MSKTLRDFRPVFVAGIGLHPYQRASSRSYVELGLTAVREALADSKLQWQDIESVFHGTCLLGLAPTRPMLRHLGATGIPMTQVENASASGSTAFRQAVLEVAAGVTDVSLALGVDKPVPPRLARDHTGIASLEKDRIAAFTHFALLAQGYIDEFGGTPADFARVAVKNHRNGALNPYAHRRQARTLEEIMSQEAVAGFLTPLQCCPVGEGAAAVIVASEDGMRRNGVDPQRAIRVLSSTARTEQLYDGDADPDTTLTTLTLRQALGESDVKPNELDIVELHDAFTVEELLYIEGMGLCGPGEAPRALATGMFDIGGDVAVSPSGGLLAMGHPLGPTGVGQIVEITRQLRGEALGRQQPDSRIGLAHMLGLGSVSIIHVLRAEH